MQDVKVFVITLFQSAYFYCYVRIRFKINYELIVVVPQPKILMTPALGLYTSVRTSNLLKLKSKTDITV